YLHARTEILLDRIRLRGRDWERGITSSYLDQVSQAYARFFFDWKRSPILLVNTSDIDFVEREDDLEDLINAVSRMKKGRQEYNPYVRGGR
ncbi:MAG: deoxynucleoside kinase, partial [Myxococcales bacterium]|nr:deoxynucleoside kinase [Myxococcales bacterium]